MACFWSRHGSRALALAKARGAEVYPHQSSAAAIAALQAAYPLRAGEFYPLIGSRLLEILEEEAV